MSLEFHVKELKGARVMATFNLLCKVYSQVGQCVCFSLRIFWLVEDMLYKHWYKFGWNHWRNEWVIKQTIVEAKCKTKQRINHKVCDENKEKNDCPSKKFLTGSILQVCPIITKTNIASTERTNFLHRTKVLRICWVTS